MSRSRTSLVALLMLSLNVLSVRGQTCNNYGILSAGTCTDCPSGIGGADCASLLCGSGLVQPQSRPVFSAALSDNPEQGCASQCTSGWTGPTCNVPQSAAACQAGAVSSGVNDITLNSGAYVWTEGASTCDVINPTLQGVFAGQTTLTFQNAFNTTDSLVPITSQNQTMNAQLWYSSNTGNATLVEQFFCNANSCTQTNKTTTTGTTVDWTCLNLRCTCIPGTTFCGGGDLDLTNTINGLSNTISVTCDAAGINCSFKTELLQSLFGTAGLTLSGCRHGECVRQSTIATLSSAAIARPEATGGNGLSGGVIAGLAVLGAVIAFLVGLIALGCRSQRRARRRPIMLPDEEKERTIGSVGLRWHDLGYALPPRSVGNPSHRMASLLNGRTRKHDGRIVLDGLSGEITGGQLCAILGPTGAGKSTFVDLLAGKRKSGERSGSVQLIVPGGWTGEGIKIGIVDQHDVLPAMSTVREALQFAAELKMPENVTKAEKAKRVFDIMQQLGLTEVADSRIGGTERRGISGGERRRLSIGLELISAPHILICDEPTSGLDSSSALRVMKVLRDLSTGATGRKTSVITTIHQPSSQIFHLFDHVMLFGYNGRLLFNAPANHVKPFFAGQGTPVPSDWNPADFLLEYASSPTTPHVSHSNSSIVDKEPESSQGSTQSRKFSLLTAGSPARIDMQAHATLLTQFEVLAARELRNLKRDWSLAVMHTVVSALVGLFVGGLYWKVDLSIGGFQSRIGSLFFLGSLLAFSSLSALSNFSNVKVLFLRERANAMYGPFAFFASRVVLDIIPLRIIPTIICSTIVYWMVGLAPDAAHFFKFLLILVLYNICQTVFNLLLAANIAENGIAILVSAVLNLFQMAFAGFFVNLSSIPAVLRWLQYIAPLKYCLEALSVNEVSNGLMISDVLAGVPVEVNAALIMGILFGFDPSAYYRDVLIIFAFIAGFAVMLVGTIIWRLREVR